MENEREKWSSVLAKSGIEAWELNLEDDGIFFSEGGKDLFDLQSSAPVPLSAFFRFFSPPFDKAIEDSINQLKVNEIHFLQNYSMINGNWLRIKGLVSKDTGKKRFFGFMELLGKDEAFINLDAHGQYRYLFNNNPMPMFIWEFETLNIVDCNQQALLKYGYTREEFLSLNIRDIRPVEDISLIEQVTSSENEYGEIHQRVWRHKTKAGQLMHVEITGHLVEFEGKKCSMVLVNDITNKKIAEEELKKERSLLRAIIDNLPLQIYVKDLEGKHLINNKFQFEVLLGAQTEKETLGKTVFDYFEKDIAEGMFSHDRRIIQNGQPVLNLEEFYFDKQGKKIWLLTNKVPLYDDNGKVIGLVGMSRDVTNKKQEEEKLKRLNMELKRQAKELEISNQELEQFAYIASHDLQEPLRMITGFLGLLDKNYGYLLDSKGKKYIHYAVDGAKRMKNIIMDLLAYSRVGKIEEKSKDIDLNILVENVLSLYNVPIQKSKASIKVNRLPLLHVPVSPLHQIFQNLIGNALKYQLPNHQPKIEIWCEEKEAFWQFYVSDNGIGIPAEKSKEVFVLFSRLHGKHDYAGSGIGLSMCKKIIENLGGEIGFTSMEGKGSTFMFSVPKIPVKNCILHNEDG